MNKMFKGIIKLGVIAAAGAAAYHYLVPPETKAVVAEKVSDKLADAGVALSKLEDKLADMADDDDDDEPDSSGSGPGSLEASDSDFEDLGTGDDEDDFDALSALLGSEDDDFGEDGGEDNELSHPISCFLMALAEGIQQYADARWDEAEAREMAENSHQFM